MGGFDINQYHFEEIKSQQIHDSNENSDVAKWNKVDAFSVPYVRSTVDGSVIPNNHLGCI